MKKVRLHVFNMFAGLIIFFMFLLMLGSVWNDSATFDEVAHIAAGFGNVTQLDYRLNPEHPPLVKALSAVSAWIFVRPYFPTDTSSWQKYVSEWQQQFDQGAKFLYGSGNDAEKIIFWSRIPIILLTLFLGWIVFWWSRKNLDNHTAILALILFAFSPTILAHGKLVTTDIAAALGFFIGTIVFVKFLEAPTKKNIFFAGLALGLAELMKFSLIMLIPIYGILILAWVGTRPYLHLHERIRICFRFFLKTMVIGLIGILMIWAVYALFTLNYPKERQFQESVNILATNNSRMARDFDRWLAKNPITRPLGHYVLGVLMANQRAAGGNTTYFLGEISSRGSYIYFPLMYLLKEPLPMFILSLIAIFFALKKFKNSPNKRFSIITRSRIWIREHFAEFSLLIVILFYWSISVYFPLNIGVRHILPTFPLIYILVARRVSEWLRQAKRPDPNSWKIWFVDTARLYIKILPKYFLVAILILWLAIDTILVFPHFLSYYNRLAGGSINGYKIATDSNYDWGQDLKRLTLYVGKNDIEKIAVDYFGGGSPKYYLGEKFEPWWSARGPRSGWLAVSANVRQGAWGGIGPGFSRKPEDSYQWLKKYEPVARIGYSIFVYKLP